MGIIVQLPAGRPGACPDRRPRYFSDGENLAGTHHVVSAGQEFTVCRVVDKTCWWPLKEKVNPTWLTWPTRSNAQAQIDIGNLRVHAFWGR